MHQKFRVGDRVRHQSHGRTGTVQAADWKDDAGNQTFVAVQWDGEAWRSEIVNAPQLYIWRGSERYL